MRWLSIIVALIFICAIGLADAKILEDFDDGSNDFFAVSSNPSYAHSEEIKNDGFTKYLRVSYKLVDDYQEIYLTNNSLHTRTISFEIRKAWYMASSATVYIKITLNNGYYTQVSSSGGGWWYITMIGDSILFYKNGALVNQVDNTGGDYIKGIKITVRAGKYYSGYSMGIDIDNIADYDFVEIHDYDQILYKTPTSDTILYLKYIAKPWANSVKINIRDYDAGIVVDTIDLGNTTYGKVSTNITDWDLGLYQVELIVDGQTESTNYFFYADGLANHSVALDKESYLSNENMQANYNIDPYYASYDYFLKIYDSNGNLIATYPVSGSSGVKSVPAPEKGGTYYIILTRSDNVELAYDVFGVVEQVVIKGYVKDQYGNPISNATVTFNQLTNIYNDTTDFNGYYESPALYVGATIYVKANKTGYQPYDTRFTPKSGGIYWLNMTLVNDSEAYGVWGIVKQKPLGNPLVGVKVVIANETYNNTVYTNDYGFYRFDSIANGTYTITASKNNYTSESKTITVSGDCRVDFTLTPIYKLTILARTSFGLYLNEFQCTIEDQTTGKRYTFNTTKGNVIAFLQTGWYSIYVTTDRYYGSATVYLYGDKVVTVTVAELPSGLQKQVVVYPPLHAITLKIVKGLKPLVDVPIVITDQYGNSTTVYTDSYGRAVFWGNKTIKYTINVNNSEKVVELYPSESEYIIVIPKGLNYTVNQTVQQYTVVNGTWQWGLTGIAGNLSKQLSPSAKGIITAIVVWLAMFGTARFMQNASVVGLITLVILAVIGFADIITAVFCGLFVVGMYVLKRWL